MKHTIFVLLGLILFSPQAALAASGCDCVTMSQLISMQTRELTTAMKAFQIEVHQDQGEAARGLIAALGRVEAAVLHTQASLYSAIQTADRNGAERNIERTFDPNSQPETVCGNNQMGGGLQTSHKTLSQASSDLFEKIYERKSRYDRYLDYQSELIADDWPTPKMAVENMGLLNSGHTLTLDELKSAERLVEALTDPMPPRRAPDSRKNSPEARTYEAQLRNYETKQGLYQGIIVRHVAHRAPTVDGLSAWAAGKWKDMGGQGDPPGLVDGKLSQDALFWLLSNMRIASANWHEKILPSLPEAGLLRDIASMQAVQLELSRRNNETLEYIAMMMALDGIGQLDGNERNSLMEQYRHMAGAAGQ